MLHSTLSARLIRNVKKAASSDPNFHYASVSRGLGSLEFDTTAAPSSSLEFADCCSMGLHDLIGVPFLLVNDLRADSSSPLARG